MNTNQKIAELENQLTAIQQELDKLKQVEVEETWPKIGDTYHYVHEFGYTTFITYDNDEYDLGAKAIGNMFRTEEEAEKEIEARKVIAELRSQPGSRKFVVGEDNHAVDVNLEDFKLDIEYWTTYCCGFGQVYFNTREDVENAIEVVGEDRILAAAKWLAIGV